MSKEPKFREEILAIKPYVPGKPIEEVQRELGISDVIKLASNENPLGPSPKALAAVKAILPKVSLYPDGSCFNLKNELGDRYGLEASNILIGNGSDESIKLLAEAYLNSGEEVIVPAPSFSEYEFAAKLMGGKCISSPLDSEFRLDLEDMLQRITSKTKIIYLCNPNNPTGTIVGREAVEAFLAKVPKEVIVAFDEAYCEYVSDPGYMDTLDLVKQELPNVIVLRTFSKIYGLAGLRSGYALGHKNLIASMERVREPFNVNILAQAAGVAAINDDAHVKASRELNEAGKKYLYQEFAGLGLKYFPTEANFIWVDTGKDSKELFGRLLQKGVIVRTGDIFGYNSFIRVTIGLPEQNERFISTLKQLI